MESFYRNFAQESIRSIQLKNFRNLIRYAQLKSRIEQIEKLSYELEDLGGDIPTFEKNVQNLLSAAYILKFGISDIAEIDAI